MQEKMHLVSILYHGVVFAAFITFKNGKPVLNDRSFEKLTSNLIRGGTTFSVG